MPNRRASLLFATDQDNVVIVKVMVVVWYCDSVDSTEGFVKTPPLRVPSDFSLPVAFVASIEKAEGVCCSVAVVCIDAVISGLAIRSLYNPSVLNPLSSPIAKISSFLSSL